MRKSWWAREDSNLQPDRYERVSCGGFINNINGNTNETALNVLHRFTYIVGISLAYRWRESRLRIDQRFALPVARVGPNDQHTLVGDAVARREVEGRQAHRAVEGRVCLAGDQVVVAALDRGWTLRLHAARARARPRWHPLTHCKLSGAGTIHP